MPKRNSRDEFLHHVSEIVDYWTSLDADKRHIGEGVAFSIMCLLDGVCVCNLGGYEVYDNETGQRITDPGRELHADIDFQSGRK